MKLQKLLKLSAPFLGIILTSCGETGGFAGKYSFILGNDTTAQVGIVIKLSDQKYVETDPNLRFDLDFKLKEDKKASSSSSYSYDDSQSSSVSSAADSGSPLDFLKDFHVEGTYVVTDIITNGKNYVSLNIKNFDQRELPIPEEYLDLINEVLPYLIYCRIAGKTLSLTIPCSINDLLLQIAWLSEHNLTEPLPQPGEEGHWWTVTIDLMKE